MSTGRIILIRHGRTFANAGRVLDTLPPGEELTTIGKLQALAAGEELAGISDNVGAVSCSVAIRAQQTAVRVVSSYEKALDLPAGSVPIRVTQGLQEIYAGDLEGRSDDSAHETYMAQRDQWMRGNRQAGLPSGETAGDVEERYRKVMEEVAAEAREHGKDYVLIGHGGAITLAALYASDVPESVALETYFSNCAMIVLDPTGLFGQWKCTMWGPVVI